jgi:hypothetical protein
MSSAITWVDGKKKTLSQEASTKKPLLDIQVATGFLALAS